jgi:hypothetical protein
VIDIIPCSHFSLIRRPTTPPHVSLAFHEPDELRHMEIGCWAGERDCGEQPGITHRRAKVHETVVSGYVQRLCAGLQPPLRPYKLCGPTVPQFHRSTAPQLHASQAVAVLHGRQPPPQGTATAGRFEPPKVRGGRPRVRWWASAGVGVTLTQNPSRPSHPPSGIPVPATPRIERRI